MPVVYCARWVLPILSPPIEDGAVAVDGELIVAIGQRLELTEKFPSYQLQNFQDAAILPGLINAHSHLELTAMRGFLDNEEGNFFAWLKKLTVARLERMDADDLYVSAALGACEALRAGVTCVGDASSSASEIMKAVCEVGLRGIVFQESFGPDPSLAEEHVKTLKDQVSRLRDLETLKVKAGVSPHAPYSVSGPQLRLIADFALAEDLPVMMHAAESVAEEQLLREGTGLFASGLAMRGIQWRAPGLSPIRYLQETGVLETRPLLAHCIRVDDEDIEIIAKSGAGVAHCPKSNAKLGHGRASLGKLLAHNIRVGLGTDSVASNNSGDLIEEARFASLMARLEDQGRADATTVLTAGTLGGARALKWEEQIGDLQAGKQADLTILRFGATHQLPSYDPVSTLLFSSSGRDVIQTVVAGKEVFRDGRITTVDEEHLRFRMREIAIKLAT